MDADVIELGRAGVVDLDGERSTRAAFELRRMLGNGVVDFGRILDILEPKVDRRTG